MSIRKLTDREHVIQRPAMYIGAVDAVKKHEYLFEGSEVNYQEVEYVPGLIKIINEIIDNSVDVGIKTNFKDCNIVNIEMGKDYVQVQDNGTGIPVVPSGTQPAELAWGHARAGSNFDDDENRVQIGMNGIGSYATNCFSTDFIGCTDDGINKYTIHFKNNAEEFTDKLQKSSGKSGVRVKFYPDLKKFGLDCIDSVHQSIIKQRLINLSMSFPEMTFKFNGKKINVGSFKKYIQLFGTDYEIYETENYKFAILPNAEDDFRQISFVNGLSIPDGGTHIDIIAGSVVHFIRQRLMKKYKTIKPGDIRNKLMVITFLKNVKNTKFNSQSKEKITNSAQEMNNYFNAERGPIPFEKIAYRIFKTPAIIDPITEVYRIKEEFKRRQELKGLEKPKKRIKSEKYYPSIGVKKYLVLVEGDSAFGGLSPVLGRRETGYYKLRGKPLNAITASQQKFTANKELSELYSIIKSENYQSIVFGTDQDLDGYHIRGLLLGFFKRYLPDYMDKIAMLETPVITVEDRKEKITRWYYNLSDNTNLKKGEHASYKKGLGSWDVEDLKYIVQTDGLDKMINHVVFNDTDIIEDWLGSDSEPRKKYILENNFSIVKL